MKKYIIFAGVNGAGKSTLYHLEKDITKGTVRINYDEILKAKYGNWKNPENQAKAMFDAKNKIDYCLENGISFNQETTLVGTMKTIKKAKELGYHVDMYYVGLDNVEIAVDRVANRVRHGGHGVKEDDIRRRYIKSQSNLMKAISICDEVKVYDNTFSFIKVASFSHGKPQFRFGELCDGWFKRMMQKEMIQQEYKLEDEKNSIREKLKAAEEVVKDNSAFKEKMYKDKDVSK